MFRLNRRRPAAAGPPAVLPGVHPQTVLVADQDTDALEREAGLRHMTGRQLQGVSGYVVGYDRGDPANSYERLVPRASQPAAAMAHLAGHNALSDRLPGTEVYDTATTNEQLNAYQAAMLARIAR